MIVSAVLIVLILLIVLNVLIVLIVLNVLIVLVWYVDVGDNATLSFVLHSPPHPRTCDHMFVCVVRFKFTTKKS
jgi:hypothetical protein